MAAPQQNRAKPMTEDQSNKLTEILSKYDAKSLSDSDAKAIVS